MRIKRTEVLQHLAVFHQIDPTDRLYNCYLLPADKLKNKAISFANKVAAANFAIGYLKIAGKSPLVIPKIQYDDQYIIFNPATVALLKKMGVEFEVTVLSSKRTNYGSVLIFQTTEYHPKSVSSMSITQEKLATLKPPSL